MAPDEDDDDDDDDDDDEDDDDEDDDEDDEEDNLLNHRRISAGGTAVESGEMGANDSIGVLFVVPCGPHILQLQQGCRSYNWPHSGGGGDLFYPQYAGGCGSAAVDRGGGGSGERLCTLSTRSGSAGSGTAPSGNAC